MCAIQKLKLCSSLKDVFLSALTKVQSAMLKKLKMLYPNRAYFPFFRTINSRYIWAYRMGCRAAHQLEIWLCTAFFFLIGVNVLDVQISACLALAVSVGIPTTGYSFVYSRKDCLCCYVYCVVFVQIKEGVWGFFLTNFRMAFACAVIHVVVCHMQW